MVQFSGRVEVDQFVNRRTTPCPMWFTDGTKTGPVTQDETGQIQDCCFSASVTVMDDTVVHVMVHEASIVDSGQTDHGALPIRLDLPSQRPGLVSHFLLNRIHY